MTNQDEQALLLSQQTLRRIIGWLGVGLPFLLPLLAWNLLTSVSDYYYSNVRSVLEGILFFLGLFLIAYQPYGDDGWQDSIITTIAGAFALVLALFPTYNATLGHVPQVLAMQFIPADWSGNIHNVGSGGLFVAFAVLSMFYFTRGGGVMTDKKKLRNAIYIVAGVGIALCIGIIGWGAATVPDQTARDNLNIFWPEAIALVLFGISWLVKGATFPFLND